MKIWLIVAGIALVVASIPCWLIILRTAYREDITKGAFAGIFGLGSLYWFYYAACEFEHDYKWPLVVLSIGGLPIGAAMLFFGAAFWNP
jgi:hypothetical protein